MKAFKAMIKTELKLSFRSIDMILFALGMPVVMALLLGMLYSQKPAFEGADYSFFEQSFGAITSISVCASGVMALPIVVSDYRNKKILKRFRVTPVSPVMILLVQVIVNMIYSILSLILVYSVSAIVFGYHMKGSFLVFLSAYFLVILSIYSIGLVVAGISPNIKISNLLCSLLYFPMLLFSGATVPFEILPEVVQKIVSVMPLTQGIKLLKGISLGLPMESILFPVFTMILIAGVCILISVKFFQWE